MTTTTASKKRMTKHDLKEDKFVTLAFRLSDVASRHKMTLLYGALGVVFVVGVLIMYQRSATSGAERSEEILSGALTHYDSGRIQEAGSGLTQFVDRYPRHARIATAALVLGNCQLAQGAFGEAEKRFDQAARSAPKGSEIWVSAKCGSAAVARAQGTPDKAIELYQEAAAASPSKELAAEAVAQTIQLQIETGKIDAAKALLAKAKIDYPGSRAAAAFARLEGELAARSR